MPLHNYNLQSQTLGFSFLVGRGSSNTKVFRSSSDIRQQLLPTRFHWGSALPSGQFLPAKGGVHRRRSGSVVVVTLWSGTNKNRSFVITSITLKRNKTNRPFSFPRPFKHKRALTLKSYGDTPAPTSSYHVVLGSTLWRLADNGGVPTKTKTGVTVIAPSTQSIRQTKTTTWCQTYRAAPNPFWHVSGGASIGGSALPQAVIIILWWRQRFHRRKWRFHNRTAFTIGGKWGRRSSSSSFKASNGERRSKVKACLPVIENHSP